MSLTVNTNLAAISAYNNLSMTDSSLSGAIQKLSSGKQVTTAADNAAGYVVSQELTQQANGYGVAISNAQDGVSVLQTAQGAMNQITSILQKMSTLALQAANGGATDSTAQAADDAEFQALSSQIDQIANTTSFGNHNLLDGTYTSQTFQIGSNNSATNQVSVSIASLAATNLLTATTTTDSLIGTDSVMTAGAVDPLSDGVTGGVIYTPTGGGAAITHGFRLAGGETLAQIQAEADSAFGAGIVTVSINPDDALTFSSTTGSLASGVDNGLLGSSTTSSTSVTGPANPSLTATSGAQAAITAVQAALSAVSSKAGQLGALQNEMTSVVANLTVGQQNLQAADSQITDTNMASEMTSFTSDQVLEQAGVAMLSQAQQSSQYVLKLLQ
jgi:flagellin